MVTLERPGIYSHVDQIIQDYKYEQQPAYNSSDEKVSYSKLESDFRAKVDPPLTPGIVKIYQAQINPFDLESSKVHFQIANMFFEGARVNIETGNLEVPPVTIRINNEQIEITNKINPNSTRTLKVGLHDDIMPDHIVSESRDDEEVLMSAHSEIIDPNKKQVESVSFRGAIVRMVTRLQNMGRLSLVQDFEAGLQDHEQEGYHDYGDLADREKVLALMARGNEILKKERVRLGFSPE